MNFALFGFLIVCLVQCLNGLENPYDVLGVRRSDSAATIKKAFKKLALQWHPDKNDDPNAPDEMIKINNAYQILSDPKKKQQFDNFGTVNDENEPHREQRSAHDFFREFRGPGGHHSFMFDEEPFGSFFHSHDNQKTNLLNDYNYKNIVLPDSYHKPFLLYAVSDICFDCLKYQRMWESVCANFASIGIGTYEVNYHRNQRLFYDIGANNYPQFIAVLNGRNIKYKGEYNERGIRDFISTILPHYLIEHIIENERDYFEQSFLDNKPQVLLFSRHMYPPLLFQVVAFEYHNKVKFAYVPTKDRRTTKLCQKFNISPDTPTIMIVKEEPSSPVVLAKGSALKRGTLRKLVASNLYMSVPRLSSQQIFEDLCPKKYATDRTLCLVLIVDKQTSYNTHLWKFRENTKDEELLNDKKLQLLYIFEDVQTAFVKSFSENDAYMVPCVDGTLPLKLLVLWRQPKDNKVLYDWYRNGWCKDTKSEELFEFVDNLVSNQVELQYETTEVAQLTDEHWHGHFWDFVKGSYRTVQHIVDSIEHPSWSNTSSISFLFFVVLMLCFGLVMPFVSDLSFSDNKKKDGAGLPRHNTQVSTTVLHLDKLDCKSQKDLLQNSPPGRLTVAVLVDTSELDEVAQSPIIQHFADISYPYSRGANYKFTWLSLAENFMWCNDITNSNKFGEFPPGSVIAFNGFRKYFFVYRPNIGAVGGDKPQVSADFLGFEESDDEGGANQERVNVKRAALRMREELPSWLDRLMEGTLREKKRVDKWPDMEKL